MAQESLSGARVLLVWSDAARAQQAMVVLTAAGYDVRHEVESLGGLVAVEDWQPVLVVLEWVLPLIDGATFVTALRAGLTDPPPVVVLAAGDTMAAAPVGVATVLTMPADPAELLTVVGRLLTPSAPASP